MPFMDVQEDLAQSVLHLLRKLRWQGDQVVIARNASNKGQIRGENATNKQLTPAFLHGVTP